MVSVGQELGRRSAVWFGTRVPGGVAIREWFGSCQRLVYPHIWGLVRGPLNIWGLAQMGLLGQLSLSPCSLSMFSLQDGGVRVTGVLLCWLRALKVCVPREKEVEAGLPCMM